jgi:hypothetical protein
MDSSLSSLLLYEPDHQAISIAPEKILLPLPLVSIDDKKKSKHKGNDHQKKLIFGRAGNNITTIIYYLSLS